MSRQVLGINNDGEETVHHDLELFHGIWQRAQETFAQVDQVGKDVMANQDRPVFLESLLDSHRELLGRVRRVWAAQCPGVPNLLEHPRQVSSNQGLDNPSESDTLLNLSLFPQELCFSVFLVTLGA